LEKKLNNYAKNRNDPSLNATSNLSPYLHFGMISPLYIYLETMKYKQSESRDSFLEELIVRRELSMNFCNFNPNYDKYEGLPDWAKKTLEEHAKDKREYIYSLETFEKAKTHDIYWNAAQLEAIHKGKISGYMRMYWGKKVIEWTESP
jgi:deoxyribodipyrimidine photo-lyase